MGFTNTAAYFLTMLGAAQAAIVGVVPFKDTYNATATSAITVTFTTAPTFVIREDYSIVFGVYPAGTLTSPAIGHRFANVDLVGRGLTSTGGGNATIKGLALHSSDFIAGSGAYTIAAGVTSGNGVDLSVEVVVYTTPLQVLVSLRLRARTRAGVRTVDCNT
ncbi:hypothetical protein BKA62DRAFT_776306 [Auriculariales sp. MPI-PUGE-AT-0066]|nr:hypothetical protein BKA62DRAFT_776306 [Auriculariales sp. MPI-PUGE-AT-0066]